MSKPMDVAVVQAACDAFNEEALRWHRLPHHGGGRPLVAERREDLEPRSYVNTAIPPTPKVDRHTFETVGERDAFIMRGCMQKAIEAAQPETKGRVA